ncbi:MobA/MobL family protein [Qipengyuania sp. MTN3-11]|uniref:MobA/MobL family protein n=1 Tax=Qipengyuania sp. MTN3-11 TaxID=3056557 RepID=UPI0036F2097B
MRQTKRTPTPPTAEERDGIARTYSYTLDGTIVSLTRAEVKDIAIHRRDAVSASRHERRRMAAILRDDRLQARINKAIQRKLDRVERRFPPKKIRVRVEQQNRKKFRRKQRRVASKAMVPLPSYEAPILDRQGRRAIVMMIDYDGAKRHSFGITGRRIVYMSDAEHCELDPLGRSIFFSNMGGDLDEILMGADVLELTQRESRVDAKTNVNIIIQMPHDVPQEVRIAILKAVAHELFGRHGLPYAAALHRPDPDGDQRNFHGHICGSWRPMTRTEAYGWEIAQDYRADLDGGEYWRHARRRIAEIMTATLERAGTQRHYTHLSNAERGLVHKPQKKLDKRKTRTAREGEFVADVEANRRVIEANLRLERALETKREERRKRALKRRLAVLAKLELAVRSPLDLRPVAGVGVGADSASSVLVSGVTSHKPGPSLSGVAAPKERLSTAAIGPVEVAQIAAQTPLEKVELRLEKGPGTRPFKPVEGNIDPGPNTSLNAVLSSGADTSPGITTVVSASLPPPALAPVSPSSYPTANLKPVAPMVSPLASLRPVIGATDRDIVLRPVAAIAPDVNALGISNVSPVSPTSQTAPILRRIDAARAHSPVIAPVAAPTIKNWPSIRPVAPVSATAQSLPGLRHIRPVKPYFDPGVRLQPVRAPGSHPSPDLRPVELPQSRKMPIIRAVSPPRVHSPVMAPVAAPKIKNWPSLRPVAPVSATAQSFPGLRHIRPVKPYSDPGVRLQPVRAPGSHPSPDLRPVDLPQARKMPVIRAVSPPREWPGIKLVSPVSVPIQTGKPGVPFGLTSVDPPGEARTDSELVDTMRDLVERLERLAREISAKRGQGAPVPPLAGRNKAASAARDLPPSSDANDTLASEIETARAFVARVKDKAIHVGITEQGLVLPQPIYWPGNRLTLRGLSDPAVQAELVRMEQRQAAFMRHIHPILGEVVTAKMLVKGNAAIIDALPEKEREGARRWATTGMWPTLLRWVTEEGERRSRRDLRRWKSARDKADGSQFALADRAAMQVGKWPLDLDADDWRALREGADRHRANLAAHQARARSQGIV